MSTHARGDLRRLDRDECLTRLAQDSVGRLAVITAGGSPAVFPVNYALDGETIIIRTDPGTKLADGPRGPACFEIDEIDRNSREGWSVTATGRLEEVTPYQAAQVARARALDLEPWADGPKTHFLRLVPSWISGRSVER